ncbi:MAG: iron-sulfur cluster assembly protein [Pyrinomonadaceae bacterium]|nr:iron-sulfur cluster assembly protein [Pyrinomonadaceae bacterium]
MSTVTKEAVLGVLTKIIDPDLHKDIVTLGFVRDLKVDGGDVSFTIMLTTPACPVKEEMEGKARELVGGLDGVAKVERAYGCRGTEGSRHRK